MKTIIHLNDGGNMFVIIVYDMKEGRTDKPRKLLRQYLQHVQNSVFEGEITQGQLNELRPRLESMTQPNESIILYEYATENHIDISVYGEDPRSDKQFL